MAQFSEDLEVLEITVFKALWFWKQQGLWRRLCIMLFTEGIEALKITQ